MNQNKWKIGMLLRSALTMMLAVILAFSAVSCIKISNATPSKTTAVTTTETDTKKPNSTREEPNEEPTPGTSELTGSEDEGDSPTTEPDVDVNEPTADLTEDTTTEPDVDVNEPTTDRTEETTTPPQLDPVVPQPDILPEQEVKIIGINLHNETEGYPVSERSENMIYMLKKFTPDSIGVQECGYLWADALDSGMGNLYARVGIDVYGNDKGGFATYVYYLKNKYRVVDSGTFWLSETPDVSAKFANSNADMPRTCTWVILENLQTGFRYVHVNTHLDRLDDRVEAIQMQMVRNLILRFEGMGYPVFSTGDYNNEQDSWIYNLMLANPKVSDSKKIAEKAYGNGTFCNYGAVNVKKTNPIDFCFVTGRKMDVLEYRVIDNSYSNYQYVSDHLGIFVHVKVKSLPRQTAAEELIPSFKSGAPVEVAANEEHSWLLELSFPQAKDQNGNVAQLYRLQMYQNGELFVETVVSGKTFCLTPPDMVTHLLQGGVKGATYRVKITPISLFGDEGEPLVQDIKWVASYLTVMEPQDADVLNLYVRSNAFQEIANYSSITKYGTVDISDDNIIFNGKGNLKFKEFSYYNDMLSYGFTIDAWVTTGDDIVTTQGYISNKDTGGFALECSSGTFAFYLYNARTSSYSNIRTPVKPNTTYHVACVYDGESMKLYLDGMLVASDGFDGYVGFPANEKADYLCIGADTNKGNGEYFATFKLKRARIYSFALSWEEIAYLYQHP